MPSHLKSPYVVQDCEKILVVVVLENEYAYSIQLQHRQIIKGIPSFRLNSYHDMTLFVRGFLFGEYDPEAYDFYCEVINAVFQEGLILQIFGASRRKSGQKMIETSKGILTKTVHPLLETDNDN